LVLRIDRERAALHGLTARDVVLRVQSAVAGGEGRASGIRVGSEELLFSVKLAGYDRMDGLALQELLIPAANGEAVPLREVATLGERQVQTHILRENQEYQRSVAYEFRGPNKLGDTVRDAVIAATRLPPGYKLVTGSDDGWSAEEREQIYGVLLLSLLLIFMVTAALFESIRQPLVVLLSVPMALIGVFLLFFYTGATFTREAYIGVIMMGGVVVNNAILLVDHINVVCRRGEWPLPEAILQATLDRVRPILMTTATTVLGLLPLVLFTESADANIWNALGYALIGGLTSSTFLILTVTPALYLLFEAGPPIRIPTLLDSSE
jgi:HAE1 family hydrophobic/amphiphilic exporter-1